MKKGLFYLFVSLQAIFLLLMCVSYYVIDDIGEVIKLKTEPVDPPDLFYGDYVLLGYEAEQIPANRWFIKETPEYGEKIYVVLGPNENGIYEVKYASMKKRDTKDNQVLVTAKYLYKDVDESHRVNYGISRYFIEDNTGEQFENRREPMIATVAIAPWGMKRIMYLKPID